MAKAHRGAGIRDRQNNGRGQCPVCKRTAIKLLYENDVEGNKTLVCKQCNASIRNSK